MTIQQILYALTIEECGSMNKAAEKLYIVQPTLTSAIRELEKEVGITIFLRTRKGITPTPDGQEFLSDIRNLYKHYSVVRHKYEDEGSYRNKFGVSTQHYSFAVKAFVEMAKRYDMRDLDLVIRETRTKDVIMDVGSLRSEIGVLYISNMNRKAIKKLMAEQGLEFHPLIRCRACVYLWNRHPLAGEKTISMEQLEPYPSLSFEQNDDASYFAEEILSENIYPRTVKVTDRSTMHNLMVGLNGYTLCSGIMSEDLNDNGYVVIPLKEDAENPNSIMQIGYITKTKSVLSRMGDEYIKELYRCIPEIEDISERRNK